MCSCVQAFLVNEVQEVYRAQGVVINDEHIEVIIRQMMRWVLITDVGDTQLIVEEKVDKHRFKEINEQALKDGGQPATCEPLLLGITKAALTSESFISAASFQETTRVLTEAALEGRVDYLRGFTRPILGLAFQVIDLWSTVALRFLLRAQGERDPGPPHPRRHRHGPLPEPGDRGWASTPSPASTSSPAATTSTTNTPAWPSTSKNCKA